MKIVVWGCSQYILNILKKNKHILPNLDFTDSNSNKWNTEIMPGKTIFPLENISADEYTYCVIGS